MVNLSQKHCIFYKNLTVNLLYGRLQSSQTFGGWLMIPEGKLNYIQGSPLAVSVINARRFPAHVHSSALELIFCLQGSATVVTAHQHLPILANELLTFDREDLHCIYSDQDNLLAIVNLDLRRSDRYSWELLQYLFFSCATVVCRPFQKPYHDQVRSILAAILYAYALDEPHNGCHFTAAYKKLLSLLVNEFSWPYKSDLDSEMNDEIRERLNSINAYVQQHYMEKITISQLSRLNNISENYFSQFMKKTTYGGFKEMLAYIRCYHAESLLLNTDLSGQEISARCGFSSTKYFYKWFRKFWGKSPLQHKKWYERYAASGDDYQIIPPEDLLPVIQKWIADDLMNSVFER